MNAQEILEKIVQQESDTSILRTRMDADLHRINIGASPKDKALADFRTYTSNNAHVFFTKVVSIIASAQLLVQSVADADKRSERGGNQKELFAVGGFRAVNEALQRILYPPLLSQYASFAAKRGMIAGVAPLRKTPVAFPGSSLLRKMGMPVPTRSEFYAMPFDPRWTYWEVGADGLLWIGHKTLMSSQEIGDFYKKDVAQARGRSGERNIEVVNIYDTENHAVYLKDGTVLKSPTKHGCPRVPGFVIPVGPTPILSSSGGTADLEHWAESILHGVRPLIDEINFVMSALSEFTKRSLSQSIIYQSQDGSKTLERDPFQHSTGTEFDLAEGEKIYPLGLLEMAKETMPYLQTLIGEWQRATMSYISWGQTPFQLSGTGMSMLNSESKGSIIYPIQAVKAAMTETANIWIDSYATGRFDPMTVSGQDRERKWFNVDITPDSLRDSADLVLNLVPELPEDEAAKWQIYMMARSGPVPGAADKYLAEHVLKVQDADLFIKERDAQLAKRANPHYAAYDFMVALATEGKMVGAAFYYAQLMTMVAQTPALAGYGQLVQDEAMKLGIPMPDPMAMAMAASQQQAMREEAPNLVDGQPGMADLNNKGRGQPGPGGMPANIAPAEAIGVQKPEGPPQQGPLVEQGRPRPGAQQPRGNGRTGG